MTKKNLLSIYDLSVEEVKLLFSQAFYLKSKYKYFDILKGKTLGLIFEKPSTRTMVSFAVAMIQLGGVPLLLNNKNLQRKRGESIHDTSIVLSRYLNIIMMRAFKHSDVEEFAKYSTVPVVNGLTDYEHPCQILADIMTIMELHRIQAVEALRDIKIVYIGDSNNISNSLLAISAILDLNFTLIAPEEYLPEKKILSKAFEYTSLSKTEIKISSDINATENADVIYTDVWTSMGFESEANKRKKSLKYYQVNDELLKKVSPNCVVLHCLPAVRGEEITSEVMSKHENSIFTQAENRLHIQKAILLHLLNIKY
ncbi:MAG: ornithine carbamoyltransferase [Endomicrobium sp.]|jgi:ornithine carbamoyltransferase|nr:ornithine carbamoyltransferase [Endomicrobium sp.]